jgi:DNA polymerase elongation subunit (family B)
VQLQFYASELALLQGFSAVVQALDPDVLVGWDMQQGSLGYLADRGLQLGFNVLRSASRTPEVRGAGWRGVRSVHGASDLETTLTATVCAVCCPAAAWAS